jgi:hypothetical protein
LLVYPWLDNEDGLDWHQICSDVDQLELSKCLLLFIDFFFTYINNEDGLDWHQICSDVEQLELGQWLILSIDLFSLFLPFYVVCICRVQIIFCNPHVVVLF